MTNILYLNDARGEYPHSYYAASIPSTDFLPPFKSLDGDLTADICVVGAGFAGLSAAIKLRQKGLDVVLVDANRVGWGASGRNGGQLGSGQRVGQKTLEKMVGRDDAKKLWQLAQDSKQTVHDFIAEFGIDCEYQSGIFNVDHKAGYVAQTKTEVDYLNEAYGYDNVRFVDRDELRTFLGTDAYFGGSLDTGSGHIHPLKLALGMAKAAQGLGVKIFEKTEVTNLKPGAKIVAETKSGSVTASHVILACNGYLGMLNRKTAGRVMPINSYIVATEPLSEGLANELIANNAAVADSKFVVNYYRLSKDRRLLFGGRESYSYRFSQDIKANVRKPMLNIYPQLKDTKIDYGWGGTLGITMNRMPHFEWLEPNIISVSGFSGHGVAMANLAGTLAAEAIGGTAERFDVMARVPTVPFPGGTLMRAPLLTLAMLYFSLRDKL